MIGFSFREDWDALFLFVLLQGMFIVGLPEVKVFMFNSHTGILHNFMNDKKIEKNKDNIHLAQKFFASAIGLGVLFYVLWKFLKREG